ncbi:unnamed protein product [Lactuca saligna]|uniref:RRM domain-containing protein n=1 Tax=Lactuca saligna TaxID=75948 RepID=A0AA35VGU7_LACSI|nr:unnamed protein product [Lactuca saligna]
MYVHPSQTYVQPARAYQSTGALHQPISSFQNKGLGLGVDQEREGEQIDRALLKNVLDIFVEIGMGQMEYYENDFEASMLNDTATYYSRKASNWILEDSWSDYMFKAEECLKREKDRVSHYLDSNSEPKLLEVVFGNGTVDVVVVVIIVVVPHGIGGAEGPDRIFVGGLPYYFTVVHIRELLESFGPLRRFDLVKDRDTGNSKGYGLCVYEDQAATDVACAALNGLKMGDKTLTVRRATIRLPDEIPTKVLCLTEELVNVENLILRNMIFLNNFGKRKHGFFGAMKVINADKLMDDGEYEEILEDMREEGRKFGFFKGSESNSCPDLGEGLDGGLNGACIKVCIPISS